MAARACVKLLRNAVGTKIPSVTRPILCLSSCLTKRRNVVQFTSTHVPNLSYCTSTISEDTESQSQPEYEEKFICRLRGLPFNIRRDELRNFFDKHGVDVKDIYLMMKVDQRFSGMAFATLNSNEDAIKLLEKDGQYIGERFVEIERVDPELFHRFADRDQTRLVKLSGLPFSSGMDDIKAFFGDLEIAENGIRLPLNRDFKSTGLAFVLFATVEDANKAVKRSGETLGERYVVVNKWILLNKVKSREEEAKARERYLNRRKQRRGDPFEEENMR